MSIYLRKKSWYYDFVHKGQRYTGSFGPVSRTVAKEELARKKAEVVEGGKLARLRPPHQKREGCGRAQGWRGREANRLAKTHRLARAW